MNKRHSNCYLYQWPSYRKGIKSQSIETPMKNGLQLNLWVSSVLSFMKTIFLNWVFIRSCLNWCQSYSEIVYVLVSSLVLQIANQINKTKCCCQTVATTIIKTKIQSPIKYTRKLDCFRLITNYLNAREIKLSWDRGHKRWAMNKKR